MEYPPAHCVWCGFTTRDVPRPNPCPTCGAMHAWGSPWAGWPTAEVRKASRERYERERYEREQADNNQRVKEWIVISSPVP